MFVFVRRKKIPWSFLGFFLLFSAITGILAVFSVQIAARSSSTAASADTAKITVVIDAGHGGEDGGTVSATGIVEKDINLAIAKKLKFFLESNGISVVMTRETDTLLYDRTADYRGRKKALDLAARKAIGDNTEHAVFISIHMNAYPQTQYHGLQVWYSPNDPVSHELADSIQNAVKQTLQPENQRQVKAATDNIYLLHHLQCPAVLVECGFLSNPEEAERLALEEYQNQIAFLIFTAILNTPDLNC